MFRPAAHVFSRIPRSVLGMGAAFWAAAAPACNPWREIHEDELAWHDADRIETEMGLSLIPLRAAAPLGPWPRVVIRPDRIDMDNRAWFLSLPEAYFLDPDASAEELAAPLAVKDGLVSLDAGRLGEKDRRGMLIPALYEALLTHVDAARAAGQRYGGTHHFGGDLTVVADKAVAIQTLTSVVYTAAQAQYGSIMFAGRADGKLQGALSAPPLTGDDPAVVRAAARQSECMMDCSLHLDEGLERAVCGALPPIAAAPGCASTELAVMDALVTLRDRCEPRWSSEPRLQAGTPPDACIGLRLSAHGLSYPQILDEMAEAHARFPALRQRILPDFASDSVLAPAERVSACAFALDPASLTDAQLDVACRAGLGLSAVLGEPGLPIDPFALGAGEVLDGYGDAFPNYVAWHATQRAAGLGSGQAPRPDVLIEDGTISEPFAGSGPEPR
ncbi:MAG: hypothetical protein VX265_16720 [Myxococcota bacterium]|nr:hypothetical protein [Myxococcota bacterium]